MQIGLAYDDFGAGQSRLQDLAEVAPDYLKFDMSLIRDIHLLTQRQQIVAGLVRLSLDLGIQPLAEGIENSAEAEVCRQIGFTHAQGYYYGKPTPHVCMKDEVDTTVKMPIQP
jgi:EAL domain-containing protein (putative c-di-GMP-specific phosphodiesterase class I)